MTRLIDKTPPKSRARDMDAYAELLREIEARKSLLLAYLLDDRFASRFRPAHIREAVYSYIKSGGKSLRPAVTMLACGALGGDEDQALPVAAAIEVFHTWTLVHDDVIDRDAMRRGAPTVHTEFARRAQIDFGWSADAAAHYGATIAMLTGDVQQAWSWSLLLGAHLRRGVSAEVIMRLADELASQVTPLLVEGETLDVQYAGARSQIDESQIIDMLWKKTGALYEFAGKAGAAIALDDASGADPRAKAMARFCSLCGTAFQIQDDILGVVGDERQLGKPVGSDIREGKSTLLILKALRIASPAQRETILQTLGDADADETRIDAVAHLLRDLGVVDYARELSRGYVADALGCLNVLPKSQHKSLLQNWARYLVARDL